MAFDPANHFVVCGAGIDGIIDLADISGQGIASVRVDGQELRAPSLQTTSEGVVVTGISEEVPDSHTLLVTITIPQINLDGDPEAAAGFAVLTTARTSIGGPRLVSGPLHLYELRPVAVTASIVES